jgi:leader peptidase (prepilin peptidase)/N-methyltransferase
VTPLPITVWLVYSFVTGLLFGSFANVVIYRVPRGMSVVAPPSACTACGRRLLVMDLIPVASWLALRGRCRYCAAGVSVRYPLVELACAVLFACMVFYTPSFSAVLLVFLAFVLLCVSMIDIDTGEVPGGLLLAGFVGGVLWVASAQIGPMLFPLAPAWHEALTGAALGAVTFPMLRLVFKKKGMGYALLTVLLGLFLGRHVILAFFAACFFMGLAGVWLKRKTLLPFAPFISAGGLFGLWFGQSIFSYIF